MSSSPMLTRHALTFTPLVTQATFIALQIVAKLLPGFERQHHHQLPAQKLTQH